MWYDVYDACRAPILHGLRLASPRLHFFFAYTSPLLCFSPPLHLCLRCRGSHDQCRSALGSWGCWGGGASTSTGREGGAGRPDRGHGQWAEVARRPPERAMEDRRWARLEAGVRNEEVSMRAVGGWRRRCGQEAAVRAWCRGGAAGMTRGR